MRNIIFLFVFAVSASACKTVYEKPVETAQSNVEAPRRPVEVKKTIKDVDYRNSKSDTAFKKKIVILPFTDQIKKDSAYLSPDSVKENARTAFINDLNNNNMLLVSDVSALKTDVKKYFKNGDYDLKTMAKDMQKSGVSSILEGQIIDVRMKKSADQVGIIRDLTATYEVSVRLRIMNIRSENEVFHTIKTVTLEEKNTRIAERVGSDQFFVKNPELVEVLIKDAFLDFSPQIQEALNTMAWEGRIAAIRADKMYLNVGRLSGVQIGDILKVVDDSSEIYDPELGYNLGQIHGRIKGTLEVVSYFGVDAAVAILHSGAGFKESDRVELYQ
jgi:TolB-like protein